MSGWEPSCPGGSTDVVQSSQHTPAVAAALPTTWILSVLSHTSGIGGRNQKSLPLSVYHEVRQIALESRETLTIGETPEFPVNVGIEVAY